MKHTEHAMEETTDFRIFLQGVFIKRCKTNPRYSLRAFAKLLDIDASTLSQLLRGKRPLSAKLQLKLCTKLNLSPEECARFKKNSSRRKNTTAPQPTYDLTLDTFQIIADWYHYAIFELVTLKDFKQDPKWMARKLNITVTEVNIALERLMRLELIKTDEHGLWKQGVPLITTTGNPFTAVAFRKLQSQVISMAQVALEEVPMEWRDQSSMTMAISLKRLDEAKEMIREFRRKLCSHLQQDDDRDAVYQLGVSFYPLTQNIPQTFKEISHEKV